MFTCVFGRFHQIYQNLCLNTIDRIYRSSAKNEALILLREHALTLHPSLYPCQPSKERGFGGCNNLETVMMALSFCVTAVSQLIFQNKHHVVKLDLETHLTAKSCVPLLSIHLFLLIALTVIVIPKSTSNSALASAAARPPSQRVKSLESLSCESLRSPRHWRRKSQTWSTTSGL